MEDEEEESSTTTTNPPFWIQQQTNSTTTTTLRRRNHLISGAVSLFLLSLLLLLLLLLFITTSFPILPTSPFSISLPNIISINVFNKGWDSINLTLVLLALLFGFLAQNNPNHDINNNNLTENNNNIGNHVNNNYDDHHHHQSHQRAADIGPSSSNPRTIEFDGKIENESVIRGWFEYSDQTDITYPSDRNTTVDDDDPHWRRDGIGLSKKNRYHDPTVGFGAMIDTEVHKSNESQVSVNTTGVVLEVRDRIAFVSGLDGVTDGEVVEFDEGTIGIVVTSYESKDNVGVALMGGGLSIRKGSFVKATGKIAQVPENVGRVVDVLGDDIEGRCEKRDSEIKEMAPAVRRRKRRTAESVANNGKSSEETSGVEQKSGKTSHRRTKSSGLELPGEKLSHRRAKSGGFERFGTVLLVGDGVARIYGLDEVTTGEIVEFEDGTIGIITNSESANNVGVVLMGDGLLIQEGSRVKATGKVAEIPDLGSVTNALAKPIDDKGKNYGSESRGVSEERETKRVLPAVRRRTRRTAESIEEKGKSIEETKGFEREAKVIHRKTKRTHEESVTIPLKAEASDEIEPHLYESSPEKLAQDAPPQNERNERKSATRDFLTSLTKRKKKQRQKSIESFDNYDTIIESQPPSPPPPSKGFFSSKKGKGKKVIEVPLPPPSPPPLYVDSQEQKSAPTTTSARRPPLPMKAQNFERESPERESSFTGAESPLHPIPSPPPPPPFKMSSWKFVVKGDYVNIGSVNSSRSVSPEREEVDSPIISSESVGGDVATGSMFCPSPDVNSKADMFIAKFREGLKLQKMNSMKMKQGVGLSNLGPVSSIDQAQA